jgi:hypothetical protein
MIGWTLAGIVAWVAWSRHQHRTPLKPLDKRHHHHWYTRDAK